MYRILSLFVFTFTFIVLSSQVTLSQELVPQDTLSLVKERGKFSVYKGNTKLDSKAIAQIFKTNPEAEKHYKAALTNKVFANIFAGVGGFLFGYQMGNVISSRPTNTTAFIASGGLVLLSIPFASGAYKQVNKAIAAYNNSLRISTPSE